MNKEKPKLYKFEIQSLITKDVWATSEKEAMDMIIGDLDFGEFDSKFQDNAVVSCLGEKQNE